MMRAGVVGIEGSGLFVLGFGTGPVPIDAELIYASGVWASASEGSSARAFDNSFPALGVVSLKGSPPLLPRPRKEAARLA